MAFLDDLSKKLSDTVDVVSKKSNEVIEIQKLHNQIRVLEKSMDESYIALGKKVFDMYQNGVELSDEDKELCEEIAGSAVLITEYEAEIADLKGEKICDSCGAAIAADALFCPKCGAKAPEVKSEPEETEEEAAQEETPAEEAAGETPAEEEAEAEEASTEDAAQETAGETPAREAAEEAPVQE